MLGSEEIIASMTQGTDMNETSMFGDIGAAFSGAAASFIPVFTQSLVDTYSVDQLKEPLYNAGEAYYSPMGGGFVDEYVPVSTGYSAQSRPVPAFGDTAIESVNLDFKWLALVGGIIFIFLFFKLG